MPIFEIEYSETGFKVVPEGDRERLSYHCKLNKGMKGVLVIESGKIVQLVQEENKDFLVRIKDVQK